MGLADTVKALILVKADVSQAKAEIKSLRGVERDAAQARLADLQQQNKGVDDAIAKWAKIGAAVAGAVAIYKSAQIAANAYLEDLRLGTAAAGANIGKLQQATAGLIEEDELLKYAAKAMHGTWQLSQKDMESVLAGAKALRKESGEELLPVVEKLTDAFSTGKTRGLKEYGITATTLQGTLKQLREHVKGLGGDTTVAGDDIRAAQVSMANSFDNLKGKLGEMVVAMAPAIDAFAKLVDLIVDAIGGLQNFFERMTSDSVFGSGQPAALQYQADIGRNNAQIARLRQIQRTGAAARAAGEADDPERFATYLFPDAAKREIEKQIENLEYTNAILSKKAAGALESFKNHVATATKELETRDKTPPKKGPPGYWETVGKAIGQAIQSGELGMGGFRDAAGGLKGIADRDNFKGAVMKAYGSWKTGAAQNAFESDDDWTQSQMKHEAAQQRLRDAEEAMAKSEQNMSTMFGTTANMDAQTVAIEAMAGAFSSLQSAAGDAYDTLISGGELTMASFKKVLANGIAAMGKDFFVRGLGETAHAIAAFVTPGGQALAAGHAKAAGAYFVASGFAAAAAVQLGYGQSTPTPPSIGGARPGNTFGGSTRHGDATRNVTVILGGGYDNMSERERNARFARAVKRGMGSEESTTIRDG